jgi:hypothetical protein
MRLNEGIMVLWLASTWALVVAITMHVRAAEHAPSLW